MHDLSWSSVVLCSQRDAQLATLCLIRAAIGPNVRRYVHVGAVSRWRVFLHSRCDAEIWCCFVYSRVGKNRDTWRECPAGAGPAGWFLPGGFSRKAGPIKHQLVLVCQSGGPARKNQSKPIAYTDLLASVLFRIFSKIYQYHFCQMGILYQWWFYILPY